MTEETKVKVFTFSNFLHIGSFHKSNNLLVVHENGFEKSKHLSKLKLFV